MSQHSQAEDTMPADASETTDAAAASDTAGDGSEAESAQPGSAPKVDTGWVEAAVAEAETRIKDLQQRLDRGTAG